MERAGTSCSARRQCGWNVAIHSPEDPRGDRGYTTSHRLCQPHSAHQFVEFRFVACGVPQLFTVERQREGIAFIHSLVHPAMERGVIAEVEVQRGDRPGGAVAQFHPTFQERRRAVVLFASR